MMLRLRLPLALLLAILLWGCDAFDTLKNGFEKSKAVSARLEKDVGTKSFVSFNWNNGTLLSVTVTFQSIPPNAQLHDLTEQAARAVAAEFKQTPKQLVVGFFVKPVASEN